MTKQIIINGVDVSGCEFLTQDEYRNPLSDEVEEQLCCGQENEFADEICTKNAPNLHCERNPDCWYKQLQRKTAELEKVSQAYKNLTNKIKETKVYSDTCDSCKDDILLYPTISGRTDYTDEEVYSIALSNIIAQLFSKTTECEKLKLNYDKLRCDYEALRVVRNDQIFNLNNKLQIAMEALERIKE